MDWELQCLIFDQFSVHDKVQYHLYLVVAVQIKKI